MGTGNLLKPADLILVRGTSLTDHLIEDISHSPYSHCAGVIKPNEVYEAQAFRLTGYQGLNFYDGQDVYRCDSATDEQRQAIIDYVLSKLDSRYNYGLIGWEALHYLFHVDLPIKDGQEQFDCSQLWCDGYRSVGIDPCPGIEFVSPGDLAKSPVFRQLSTVKEG